MRIPNRTGKVYFASNNMKCADLFFMASIKLLANIIDLNLFCLSEDSLEFQRFPRISEDFVAAIKKLLVYLVL